MMKSCTMIVVVAIILLPFQVVKGKGYIQVRLVSFTDPEGRQSDGTKCHIFLPGCNVELSGAISVNSIDGTKSRFKTQLYPTVTSIDFTDTLDQDPTLKNPLTLNFEEEYQGLVYVDILSEHQHVLFKYRIDEYRATYQVNASANDQELKYKFTQKGVFFQNTQSTLSMSISVHCATDYYGAHCKTYCKTHDKFTCNNKTGEKECIKDYYGASCETFCKANGKTDNFVCNPKTGDKICFDGWEGQDCRRKVSHSKPLTRRQPWMTTTGLGITTLVAIVISSILLLAASVFIIYRRRRREDKDYGFDHFDNDATSKKKKDTDESYTSPVYTDPYHIFDDCETI